jgi:Xaa-Pro aminopeptidase
MNADVLYLTNHYSAQPLVGDESGVGSARTHAVCILPVDGPTTLVVDGPWWREELVVADDIRPSLFVAETAVQAVRDLALEGRRLAFVGASYMTASAYIAMREGLPSTDFVRTDRLIQDLRIHKSDAEIELIRRASTLGNRTFEALMDAVVEGATEAEAVAEASRVLVAGGGVLWDALCTSGPWSHQLMHARLPSADPVRRLERGDIFHVDCYGAYGGYFFDFARSRVVGDDPSESQRDLLEAVIEGVETICAAIRPGITGGDVYNIAADWVRSSDVVASVQREAREDFPGVGHGLGLMWEPPYFMPEDTTPIEQNMYLAVELLFGNASIGGATFEHNGLVTDTGFEVLSTATKRWW